MTKGIKAKQTIKFTNTKALRVGKGMRTLRERRGLSIDQLAGKVNIEPSYLSRLEEGYEPEVDRNVLENIAESFGVYIRSYGYRDEKLVDIFLYATSEEPPRLM